LLPSRSKQGEGRGGDLQWSIESRVAMGKSTRMQPMMQPLHDEFTTSDQQVAVVAAGVTVAIDPVMVPPETAIPGAWSSEVYDCTDDCCICCASMWFPCIPIAQLAQRFYPTKYKCKVIATVLFLLSIAGFTFQEVGQVMFQSTLLEEVANCQGDTTCLYDIDIPLPTLYSFNAIAMLLSLVSFITVVCILRGVRAKIRRAHSIPPGCCGENENCCCAFWCASCTTCQILRHVITHATNGNGKASYKLCSETACATDGGIPAHAV